MRILIKGGVWKNTEDEILKAAVMKYGKNQWSRISSLLVRKSAKQCKARWMEWLGRRSRRPSGRAGGGEAAPPGEADADAVADDRADRRADGGAVLEHYERLLDQATRKDQGMEDADDPRRLRPGEIDPNPETKPARPDPVDMDEDEKEMLSERARLANTRGKKAKRKAREMQLEEARRLAALQKRRELKAAGIEMPSRQRKARGIDYNTEVPFQKVAPAGFYDTVGEDAMAEAAIQSDDKFERVEIEARRAAPRRGREKARKQDAEKAKRKREDNLPDAVAQLNRLNDPLAIAKRGKLMLPPPQARAAPRTPRAREPLARPAARALLGAPDPTPHPVPAPFPGDRPRARECGQGERVDALRRRRLRRHVCCRICTSRRRRRRRCAHRASRAGRTRSWRRRRRRRR